MPEHDKVCRTSAAPPQWFYSDYDLNANRSGGASQLRICSRVFDLEETWKVFIAFPSCHCIAVLSLATGRWNDLFFLSTRFLNFQLQESEQEKKSNTCVEQYWLRTDMTWCLRIMEFTMSRLHSDLEAVNLCRHWPLSNSLLNLSFCHPILFFFNAGMWNCLTYPFKISSLIISITATFTIKIAEKVCTRGSRNYSLIQNKENRTWNESSNLCSWL